MASELNVSLAISALERRVAALEALLSRYDCGPWPQIMEQGGTDPYFGRPVGELNRLAKREKP